MKIIYTTYEDFIAQEIADSGFDYVEAQFLLGYEPTQVNGIWCWQLTANAVSSKKGSYVQESNKSLTRSSDTLSSDISNRGSLFSLVS